MKRELSTAFLFMVMASPAAVQSASQDSGDRAPPSNIIVVTPNPQPWSDLGQQVYGRSYEVYIPKDIKSNNPDAMQTYDAGGRPRNGQHLTPEGAACAEDADCRVPMECFNRADSGAIPIRVCAFPPAY